VARDREQGAGYVRSREVMRSARQKLLADEKGLEQALLEATRA